MHTKNVGSQDSLALKIFRLLILIFEFSLRWSHEVQTWSKLPFNKILVVAIVETERVPRGSGYIVDLS
jgi:hypothetical protein